MIGRPWWGTKSVSREVLHREASLSKVLTRTRLRRFTGETDGAPADPTPQEEKGLLGGRGVVTL